MGDSSETLEQLWNIHEEAWARDLLKPTNLHLNENSIPWILDHIDCFLSQSRGNKSIT
jgi:hypothetical protein